MELLYERAMLPGSSTLRAAVARGAHELHDKLIEIDPRDLGISEYGQRFLRDYISDLQSALQRYSYILLWCLDKARVPLERCTFMDYGGGQGVLALLARQVGVGTVIYNDIYDVSCTDARRIARQTGLVADHYVCGDVGDTVRFLKETQISCDAVASNDVIDHIYNVETFLSNLAFFSTGPIVTFMITDANGCNPDIASLMTRVHYTYEYCNRPKLVGHKERDSLEAFLEIRRQVITRDLDRRRVRLDEAIIDMIALRTRGMAVPDILRAVKDYVDGKTLTDPDHLTNTCDPRTGNWAERLMDPRCLARVLGRAGFRAGVAPGYYPSKDPRHTVANPLISILGNSVLRMAPAYAVYGIR